MAGNICPVIVIDPLPSKAKSETNRERDALVRR